ncbi:Ricin-type beta-trefoil lectin domain-like [Micromonospora viridifaciens]|uniref:Ricin-type beta-trefoil lectin domain-like n=2 Tax=Micromonospora viridifaciens TaxID=1881 RepID=A0A1C4WC04_MICVI|nr:Ricin-type beta-trefoil lectin domain-like [Micromonospora viridifaciens]
MAFLMIVTGFPSGAQAAFNTYQYYEFVNRHSGGCMEVDYGRTYSGADVTEDWCFGSVNYQRWQFRPTGEPGWYQIAVKHTGMCLSVRGAQVVDGADVVQESCMNVDHQKWKVVDLSYGYIQIVAKHSYKCLDLAGGDWNIIQHYCWNGNNQQWWLRSVS